MMVWSIYALNELNGKLEEEEEKERSPEASEWV